MRRPAILPESTGHQQARKPTLLQPSTGLGNLQHCLLAASPNQLAPPSDLSQAHQTCPVCAAGRSTRAVDLLRQQLFNRTTRSATLLRTPRVAQVHPHVTSLFSAISLASSSCTALSPGCPTHPPNLTHHPSVSTHP